MGRTAEILIGKATAIMGTSVTGKTWISIAAGVALCILAVAHRIPTAAGEGTGEPTKVHVIDGDTVEIGPDTRQLEGIDAPELGQRCLNGTSLYQCGMEATFALRKLIGVMPITCGQPNADGESECVSKAGNVGLMLVQQGAAVARPGAPAAYLDAQRTARAGSLGLWRGDFTAPSKWRQGERLDAEKQAEMPCPVKGVEEPSGRKVYLVPTDAEFDKVTPDPTGGPGSTVRLFCSDEEARAAGFVRPGG
jgi:endonuclease YncB( thermonuclease family)